jgi:hypothetical protein
MVENNWNRERTVEKVDTSCKRLGLVATGWGRVELVENE